MTADEPLRHQFHLAAQEGFVERRQHVFARGELPADQSVERVAHQRARTARVVRLLRVGQRAEVRIGAQIGDEHEAGVEVDFQHARHVHVGGLEQLGDLHKFAALFRGRRVDGDQRAGAVVFRRLTGEPEIAAKTGVGRSRRERVELERIARRMAVQPGFEQVETGILGVLGGGQRHENRRQILRGNVLPYNTPRLF